MSLSIDVEVFHGKLQPNVPVVLARWSETERYFYIPFPVFLIYKRVPPLAPFPDCVPSLTLSILRKDRFCLFFCLMPGIRKRDSPHVSPLTGAFAPSSFLVSWLRDRIGSPEFSGTDCDLYAKI